jgi:hypothetical protein
MKALSHTRTSKKAGASRRGGFIIVSELLLVATILVIGLIIGWVTIRNTLLTEMEDFSHSIGGLNQSYAIAGVRNDNGSASTGGSAFIDAPDDDADDDGTWVFVPASTQEGLAP